MTKHLVAPGHFPEDCAHLTEIKIKRISRFDSKAADEDLKRIDVATVETHGFLDNLTGYVGRLVSEPQEKI